MKLVIPYNNNGMFFVICFIGEKITIHTINNFKNNIGGDSPKKGFKMAKVKMSDITSGSENVKEFFRKSVVDRTILWLKKQKFSNAELIEIFNISEKIENNKDKRKIYQNLILSQPGPFDSAVFNAFKDALFETYSLLALITNSKNISVSDLRRWIDYAMLTDAFWFTSNFFINGKCLQYGIDVYKAPFNMAFARAVVLYSKNKYSQTTLGGDYMWSVLDSMTDDEKYTWYYDNVERTYQQDAVKLLVDYPNTTEKILTTYYGKTKNEELATHKNFPLNLKIELFNKTRNEKFLPRDAIDIFLF